jgi:putative CRISPR-associated protein (TIGR02619 family)
MVRILHIETTGTSLLRNAATLCENYNSLAKHCAKLDLWAKADVDSTEDIEAGNNAVPGSLIFKGLLEALSSDPRRLSAEMNAFLSFLDTLKGPHEHMVFLLSSDTGSGWLCSKVIEEFLRSMERIPSTYVNGEHLIKMVEIRRVPMLGRDFSKGTLNLVAETKKIITKFRPQVDEIAFNLTGGYKPETGFLLLTAGLLGANKAYYIHETMRRVVEVPILPLSINEPVATVLKNIASGKYDEIGYRILREYRILRPWEKEPHWLRELAKVLLE